MATCESSRHLEHPESSATQHCSTPSHSRQSERMPTDAMLSHLRSDSTAQTLSNQHSSRGRATLQFITRRRKQGRGSPEESHAPRAASGGGVGEAMRLQRMNQRMGGNLCGKPTVLLKLPRLKACEVAKQKL